ncbi:hypothetical protein BC828DRAFT_101032 [Blastocladiella britannica]|nr:hypothetical protein BC828DRAFT_101032 [Blastocladiella britannica]
MGACDGKNYFDTARVCKIFDFFGAANKSKKSNLSPPPFCLVFVAYHPKPLSLCRSSPARPVSPSYVSPFNTVLFFFCRLVAVLAPRRPDHRQLLFIYLFIFIYFIILFLFRPSTPGRPHSRPSRRAPQPAMARPIAGQRTINNQSITKQRKQLTDLATQNADIGASHYPRLLGRRSQERRRQARRLGDLFDSRGAYPWLWRFRRRRGDGRVLVGREGYGS